MPDDPQFLDWYRGIVPHLGAAKHRALERIHRTPVDIQLEHAMLLKCRRGWAEHDGGIVHMTPVQVTAEAIAEVLDLFAYESELLRRESWS